MTYTTGFNIPKLSKKMIGFGVLGIGVLFLLFGMAQASSIDKEGVRLETQMTAQYLDNQNELAAFTNGFYELIGVADLKVEALDRVLENAVRGRYDDGTSIAADPLGGNNPQLISAMVEAYPDLGGLDSYDEIIDYVAAGREAFKNEQSKLLDQIRAYDTWSESGIFKPMMIDFLGFPSDTLRAQIGEEFVTGDEALEQMRIIVTTGSVSQAFETGEQGPLIGGPTNDEEG